MSRKAEFLVEMPEHPFCIAMRERREALEWSYRTLAEKVGGCSRSYLSDVEQGRYAPSVEYGMILCQALGIPIYFCIDYIKQHAFKKQEILLEREYSKWFSMIPENVAEDLLRSHGSQMVHQAYYNESIVTE